LFVVNSPMLLLYDGKTVVYSEKFVVIDRKHSVNKIKNVVND